mgnify:CR=1 FL=1
MDVQEKKASHSQFIDKNLTWTTIVHLSFLYRAFELSFDNLSGEILNVVTKTVFLFGYALGLQPTRQKRSCHDDRSAGSQ